MTDTLSSIIESMEHVVWINRNAYNSYCHRECPKCRLIALRDAAEKSLTGNWRLVTLEDLERIKAEARRDELSIFEAGLQKAEQSRTVMVRVSQLRRQVKKRMAELEAKTGEVKQ